jgi:hypothetical protein
MCLENVLYLPLNIFSGPTLSTSTSSFEALDPHDPNLSRLATTMFQKTADYLFGELTTTQVSAKCPLIAPKVQHYK